LRSFRRATLRAQSNNHSKWPVRLEVAAVWQCGYGHKRVTTLYRDKEAVCPKITSAPTWTITLNGSLPLSPHMRKLLQGGAHRRNVCQHLRVALCAMWSGVACVKQGHKAIILYLNEKQIKHIKAEVQQDISCLGLSLP
jgi:hypothetical protein